MHIKLYMSVLASVSVVWIASILGITNSANFLINASLIPIHCYMLGVSDCDILRLSRFWNITYHDCENNPDYIILTIFDEKSMQQVMFCKVQCVLWFISLGYFHITIRQHVMWWCSQYNVVDKHRIIWFYPDLTLPHLIKCVLSYNPWLSHGLCKPNWWKHQELTFFMDLWN